MTKSSSFRNGAVKANALQRQQLLDLLKPNIKAIVKEGVDQYIGNGTRFMLELLMHAEARELCGDWHSRSDKRTNRRVPKISISPAAEINVGTIPK